MLDTGSPHGRGPRSINESVSKETPAAPRHEHAAYCWLMRRDLRHIDAPRPWPTGQHTVAFSDVLAPQVHALLVSGYQQGGGHVAAYDTWRALADSGPESDPSLWIITADEHGLTGAAHCWTSAFIRDFVVHPRARRRGLAMAMLSHAFHLFHLRGEASLDLKVMEGNQAARSLYETSGMIYIQRAAAD